MLEAASTDGRSLWLGPRLSVFDVPKVLDGLSATTRDSLENDGFLRVPVENPCIQDSEVGAHVLILDPYFEKTETEALLASLSRRIPGDWISSSWAAVLTAGKRPELVVYFGVIEDFDALSRYVLAADAIVVAGEAAEGPHVGPCIRSLADLEAYQQAARDWASSAQLDALGFTKRPISIGRYFATSAERIGEAVSRVMHEPFGRCFVIDEYTKTPLRLWTSLGVDESFESLRVEQAWSKGLFSALQVDADGPIFLGSCTTPAHGDAISEVAGGKGTNHLDALMGTLGEAIERFCMAQGYRGGVPLVPLPPEIAPERFHPVGTMWDEYLDSGKPSGVSVVAKDEVLGVERRLPADLCIEREVGYAEHPRVSGITSSGLAAYPDYDGAVLRGALEVLECDSFYPNFLSSIPGRRVPSHLLVGAGPSAHDLDLIEAHLHARGQKCTFVRYESEIGIPIVHVFLLDTKLGWMSRGFGSGRNWYVAAKRAVLEACQIATQHEFVRENGVRSDTDVAYAEWQTPVVISAVSDYLESCPVDDHLPNVDFGSDSECLAHLKSDLGRLGRSLYVVPFPCPVAGWSAVRVLITGATLYQEPSRSDGGAKIMTRSFRWGIPI